MANLPQALQASAVWIAQRPQDVCLVLAHVFAQGVDEAPHGVLVRQCDIMPHEAIDDGNRAGSAARASTGEAA